MRTAGAPPAGPDRKDGGGLDAVQMRDEEGGGLEMNEGLLCEVTMN